MNLLFLCTGNSCRSQMAEGWARSAAAAESLKVFSAGIEAHGLNPLAVKVMQEAGIDISGQTSNRIDEYDISQFDVVVTVCGDADENCPVLRADVHKEHWPLPDPAKLKGSEAELLNGFRESRDEIERRVRDLLKRIV